MDRLEFAAELRRDGFSVVNASLKPNAREANHCHDFDARLYVLGGEITITRDNTSEAFRAGQCCEVRAGCMHAEHVGPEGVAYVSGRLRRGPLTREAFESDLRREGFEVVTRRPAGRLNPRNCTCTISTFGSWFWAARSL